MSPLNVGALFEMLRTVSPVSTSHFGLMVLRVCRRTSGVVILTLDVHAVSVFPTTSSWTRRGT